MQKYLLVVDLQKANSEGVERFTRKLEDWINAHAHEYVAVLATVRKNTKIDNFERHLKDNSCQDPKLLNFHCDKVIEKEGYGLDEVGYNCIPRNAHIDVVGMETQASIMAIALDLFGLGYDFTVYEDLCYCNDGKDIHKAAVTCLKSSIGTALR
jgi:nicotinamidase-related amidase